MTFSRASGRWLPLAMLICLAVCRADARPKIVFWVDTHPGFPPREEWLPGDTPEALAKEMHYKNMSARAGSPKHYEKLKQLGFDAVGLLGFEGPFYDFDPSSDDAANLDPVQQTRNSRHYIGWAQDQRQFTCWGCRRYYDMIRFDQCLFCGDALLLLVARE